MNNMYENVVTWNPLGGKCTHSCKYCSTSKFMRYPNFAKKYIGEPYLDEKQLKPLGKGKTIFVCAQNDLFADGVKFSWINQIIWHCREYPENTYMIQTKNAKNMFEFMMLIPEALPNNFMLGITLETDNDYDSTGVLECKFSGGNHPHLRSNYLSRIEHPIKYITIEPIMRFDLPNLVWLIDNVKPEKVYIGANSYPKIKLPEPSKEEVLQLISELGKFTTVVIKDNLKRLLI